MSALADPQFCSDTSALASGTRRAAEELRIREPTADTSRFERVILEP